MTIQAEGGAPMSQTLKPCPFCGNEDVLEHGDSDFWWIGCGQCHAEGPTGKLDDAIAAWNTRPQYLALVDVLKAVVDCLDPDKDDGYRADDPEGAMDTAFALACKVLHEAGERP